MNTLDEALVGIETLGWPQFLCGLLLILALFALAVTFALRQRAALRLAATLAPEGRRAVRDQAWRRLVGCLLLLVLAMLLGLAVFFLEVPAQRLAEARATADFALSADQLRFVTLYTCTWLAILTVLILLVLLAAWDVYSIRRQAVATRRRLLDQHKALLDEEAAVRRRHFRS